MAFLVRDYQAYVMADDYTSFVKQLVWYRMYCACHAGTKKEDYQKGFEKLQDYYERIFQYEKNGAPSHINRIINPYFEKIKTLLEAPSFGDNNVGKIADVLMDFETIEDSRQNSFREQCLEFRLNSAVKSNLPRQLFSSIEQLLDTEQDDAIIVEAFKYLDGLLRTVLNSSSSDNFGENLINSVFSPQTGYLQLNTHINEQIGMRNFFSGANAIFRNPSAHRNQFTGKEALFYGEGQNFSVIAVELVGVMSRMVKVLLYKKISANVVDSLERICIENNLSTESGSFRTSWWAISKIPDASDFFASGYRLRVFLNCEKDDVSLRVLSHDSVEEHIVSDLKEYLEIQTGLFVKTSNK